MIHFLAKATHHSDVVGCRREFRRPLRHRIATLAVTACALLFVQTLDTQSVKAESSDRPNVVLIMADDLGYGDLGCYGQSKIQTPRIDEMARQGMRFTDHYSGSNVCAPTRCSLVTGLHTGHCTIRGNRQAADAEGQWPLPADATTIGGQLQAAGYVTGMFGKWGLGNPGTSGDPLRQGWDTYYGYTDQIRAHNYFPDFLLRDGAREPLDNEVVYLSEKLWHKGIGSYATEQNEYSHDLIMDAALQFIRRNQGVPFFAYLPVALPHGNGEARGSQMEVPDFGPYADRSDWSVDAKGYASMVSRLDTSVGEVIDLLKQLELDENTLVLFTSDNGPVRTITPFFDSNGPFQGIKRDVYEGGIRAPLVAWWPGTITGGSETDHVSAHWDYLPTFLELAGRSAPANTDGISLLPTLLDQPADQRPHDFLYWEDGADGSVGIRVGKWKGILPPESADDLTTWRVFNLEKDPGETNNLAGSHPDLVTKFAEMFRRAHSASKLFPHPAD